MSNSEVERLARLETRADKIEENVANIFKIITDIKDNLLKRPSWAVLAMITLLSSATVGLLVASLANK